MLVYRASIRLLFFCLLGGFSAFATAAGTSENIYWLDLERQPLRSTLNKLGKIAHFDWGALKAEYVDRETAAPLKGYYTARQAVAELFKGKNISFQWLDNNGLLLIDKKIVPSPPPDEPLSRNPAPRIEEITVVGSHIRGSSPTAPVFSFDRETIKQSGLADTQAFFTSLPQIFGGGTAEGVIPDIKGDGAKFNIADASGVNLHGMGFDSTLVLINGHRIAPVGFGDVVDISSIPLNAIERIDVMADGASAIYGSDAVGGVVNIVLRERYDGVETQIGYGDFTGGSGASYSFNHTFGKNWPSGNVLLNYSYRKRARLDTEERSFTQTVTDPSDILGKNKQHNIAFSASQQLTTHTDVYAEALYGTRGLEQNRANSESYFLTSHAVSHTSLISGVRMDLGNSWQLDTSILYSDSSTALDTNSVFNSSNKSALNTRLFDVKIDGEAFQSWGGTTKLALGVQHRREAFAFETESPNFVGKERSSRNIVAVFTELHMPLIGENNSLPGLKRLEFTLAGRNENYSDFGSNTTPKAGLLWSPTNSVDVRATYSKSFRAPHLFELSKMVVGQGSTARLLPSARESEEEIATLLIAGYNGELEPEQAVTWTIGTDVIPVAYPDIKLSLTYFSIDFTDRIQTAFQGPELKDALIDPRYAPVVIHNPDMDSINFWISQPYFVKRDDISINEIGALIDNRLHNIAAIRERGVDFDFNYRLDTEIGAFAFRLSGIYLLTLESQATEAAPFVNILNTPYNPVDLKIRNSVTWKLDSLTSALHINYVGSYKDRRPGQGRDVDAWATLDLNIDYAIKKSERSWLQDATISLTVNNVFDREPPFVANELGYNFDATNANAFGRRIAVNITKKW